MTKASRCGTARRAWLPALATANRVCQDHGVARLLNRFGRRLCVLEHLNIEYPVGRAGSRFEAFLPTSMLRSLDLMALRFFVILDDSGNRYPAVIEQVGAPEDPTSDTDFVAIRGVVVTNMS